MLGMILYHPESNRLGPVDEQTVHPDGRALVRINDRWFAADECAGPADGVEMPGPSRERAEFIQPAFYVEYEGGDYVRWDAGKRPERIHAIVFSDGLVFDTQNGWREVLEAVHMDAINQAVPR